MIFEYRFRGTNQEGRPVTGTFSASGGPEAKRHLAELRQRYQITISKLERKRDFLYKVKVPGRVPFSGRQAAFSKDEVAEGLRKLGYEDFSIGRVLFDLPGKPSVTDILMFIRLSANMLRDKLSFGKILELLAEEQTNRKMKETLYQIESQLKAGAEGREVFLHFTNVFGRFPAYMLGLATRSGNMAEIFDSTAEFIERDLEISKTIRKALLSPLITIVATLAAFGYYVLEIFPATATLFTKYGMETPPLTKGTLDFSVWLGHSWWIISLAALGVALILWRWWSTPKGRIWRDRNLVKIPVLGPLVHKMSIEIYFRVFGTMYSGAGDNIETIRIAAEACRNAWMEDQIKRITLPLMLREGEAFVPAMEAAGVFTRTTITRLKTGQETGNLMIASQQISNFYKAETNYRMANLIEVVQTVVWLFVAAMITFLTLVSAEVANISPPTY
ncbi:MAG: type II secretion system F family protein [Candidatus Cloacimonetes bacterium]|nr:type II secretion system F family protein [Candidatus Cloacimonadota bacterium]MDD4224476.1 type II secretion system F family protein [Candidatus Cloacimonadota bacterium]